MFALYVFKINARIELTCRVIDVQPFCLILFFRQKVTMRGHTCSNRVHFCSFRLSVTSLTLLRRTFSRRACATIAQ